MELRRPPVLGAICLLLVSATAASAQRAGPPDERSARPDLRLRVTSETASADPARPRIGPDLGLFEGSQTGVGVTSNQYRAQDGSSAIRRGLIGSLPLSPGVNAGVGLFVVTHEDQREPEFRRGWTAKNIGPRNRKVAAVGVNVNF